MTALRDLLEPRVTAGAELLDRQRPGWADRISLDQLNLLDGCNCVLGQVFADDAARRVGDRWRSAYLLGIDVLGLHANRNDDVMHGFDLSGDDPAGDDAPDGDVWTILDALWIEQIRARRSTKAVV